VFTVYALSVDKLPVAEGSSGVMVTYTSLTALYGRWRPNSLQGAASRGLLVQPKLPETHTTLWDNWQPLPQRSDRPRRGPEYQCTLVRASRGANPK
jgi:hypothetical protein